MLKKPAGSIGGQHEAFSGEVVFGAYETPAAVRSPTGAFVGRVFSPPCGRAPAQDAHLLTPGLRGLRCAPISHLHRVVVRRHLLHFMSHPSGESLWVARGLVLVLGDALGQRPSRTRGRSRGRARCIGRSRGRNGGRNRGRRRGRSRGRSSGRGSLFSRALPTVLVEVLAEFLDDLVLDLRHELQTNVLPRGGIPCNLLRVPCSTHSVHISPSRFAAHAIHALSHPPRYLPLPLQVIKGDGVRVPGNDVRISRLQLQRQFGTAVWKPL